MEGLQFERRNVHSPPVFDICYMLVHAERIATRSGGILGVLEHYWPLSDWLKSS